MVINVHAGHNPDGKIACGAVGLIAESTEARRVKDGVIARLRALGHTVYDCTVDNGTGQTDVLQKIVAQCNAHAADLDVSIHFNSGAGDSSGNGVSTGTEVYIYTAASRAKAAAQRTVDAIAALGFRNRGVKTNAELYVLRHTAAPAMLVECCFVDDADDVKLYDPDAMAAAVAAGITGQAVPTAEKNTIEEEIDMTREEVTELIDQRIAAAASIAGTGDAPAAWAKEGCDWAKDQEIFQGDGAGNYGWQQPVTREQLANILLRVL